MKFQRIAIASLVLAAAGLTACSSTAKNTAAGSTSVTGSTTPDVVSSTQTTPPPAATNPPATNPPETQPPATNPPAPTRNLYDQVESPNVPGGHTDPFASSGVLGNGVYWVQYNGGETFTPDITVYQAFFGQECIDQATAAGDECLNDIFVLDSPSRDIADLPFADGVHLTIAASDTQLSYWITPDELRTIRASSPSVDNAPDGVFVPFPFLMTVENGKITKFEQVWTP
ncbi:MAG: hypothetical protein K8R99_02325 [Actinomycetia bacterium]|nr:hypothetical protein [Actinomycetes bacterium]